MNMSFIHFISTYLVYTLSIFPQCTLSVFPQCILLSLLPLLCIYLTNYFAYPNKTLYIFILLLNIYVIVFNLKDDVIRKIYIYLFYF